MDTRAKYFFVAYRTNFNFYRERVAAQYRCDSIEELREKLADACSKEWVVEKVYGPDSRPICYADLEEMLRVARVAGFRLQEERARLRRGGPRGEAGPLTYPWLKREASDAVKRPDASKGVSDVRSD
jgi:hypothetical protein